MCSLHRVACPLATWLHVATPGLQGAGGRRHTLLSVATTGGTPKTAGTWTLELVPGQAPRWFGVCLAQHAHHNGGPARWPEGPSIHAPHLAQVALVWGHGRATLYGVGDGHTNGWAHILCPNPNPNPNPNHFRYSPRQIEIVILVF